MWGVKSIKLTITCIGFQVLGRYHDHEADGPFIAKHLVGPAADRAHTLDCSYTIVGYQHLEQKQKALTKTASENMLQCHQEAKGKDFHSYFLYDTVATKPGDKLCRRGHREVPLKIHLSVFTSFFHQVKTGHARPAVGSSWLAFLTSNTAKRDYLGVFCNIYSIIHCRL